MWFAVDLIFSNGQFLATVPSAHTPGSPVSWITGLEGVSAALLYVTNWLNVEPHWHLWYGYSPISHLWTLAVEEQFYVIWAPVMILLLRLRRHVATLAAAAIAFVALIEPLFLSSSNFNRVYFGTDTRSAALFCGALCAFVGSTKGWRVLRTATWAPFLGAAIVGAIVWSCYALRQEGHRGLWNTGLIVCTLACALAVVFIVERPERPAARFLSSQTARRHRQALLRPLPVVLRPQHLAARHRRRSSRTSSSPTSFLAAEISYRFVELPALRLKHHFETTKTTDRPSVPALAEHRGPRNRTVRGESPHFALTRTRLVPGVLRCGHAGGWPDERQGGAGCSVAAPG